MSTIITLTGCTACCPPAAGRLWDICLASDGNVWITDQGLVGLAVPGIWRVTPAGKGTLFTNPNITVPWGICVGDDGNLWIANQNSSPGSNVVRMDLNGNVLNNFPMPNFSPSNPSAAYDICVGADGNFYVSYSYGANELGIFNIYKLTPSGVYTTTKASGFQFAGSVCAGNDGAIYTACSYMSFLFGTSKLIGRLSMDNVWSNYSPVFGFAGGFPQDICAGPDGQLWTTATAFAPLGPNNPNGASPASFDKVTTSLSVTVYQGSLTYQNSLQGICSDGTQLWAVGDALYRLQTDGTFTRNTGASGANCVQGSDGRIWITSTGPTPAYAIAGVVVAYDPSTGVISKYLSGY